MRSVLARLAKELFQRSPPTDPRRVASTGLASLEECDVCPLLIATVTGATFATTGGGRSYLVAPGIPAVTWLAREHFELRRVGPVPFDHLGENLGLLAGRPTRIL
jgi:hypothetical protein